MRATAHRPVFFAPGALFAIGALGVTTIAHWNHVFDSFSFHEIVFGQLQLVCRINKPQYFSVFLVNACNVGSNAFLTDFFKLDRDGILECYHVRIHSGVDSAIHFIEWE
jgi:hypothetical protein